MLNTTLVGTNLSTVVASAIATSLLLRYWLSSGEFIATLIMSVVLLFFGEIMPKTYYRATADRSVPAAAQVFRTADRILRPLSWPIEYLAMKLAGPGRFRALTRERFMEVIDMVEEEDVIDPGERDMFTRIADFSKTRAREIMTPLADVVAVGEDETMEEFMPRVMKENYSRIPVYRERIDNITGLILARELLYAPPSSVARALMRTVEYIPGSMPMDRLFNLMKGRALNLVVAVDEYGASEGIITMEDVLEEIFGEIEDEHDEPRPEPAWLGGGMFFLDAREEIDKLNEKLDLEIPRGNYETIGGFILEMEGRIPVRGEVLTYPESGIMCEIVDADERSILGIKLTVTEKHGAWETEPPGGTAEQPWGTSKTIYMTK